MTDIVPRKAGELAPAAASPAAWIDRALSSGASPDALEQLYALYERTLDREAKGSFFEAFAEFQKRCPGIPKRGGKNDVTGGGSGVRWSFAKMEDIQSIVRPLLSELGLIYTFSHEVDGLGVTEDGHKAGKLVALGVAKVTCKLQHVSGHGIESCVTMPLSSSAGMSPQQMVSSAMSAARRLALIGVLGLTSCEPDYDESALPSAYISEDDAERVAGLVAETGSDVVRFLEAFQVDAIEHLRQSQLERALGMLRQKKAKAEVKA